MRNKELLSRNLYISTSVLVYVGLFIFFYPRWREPVMIFALLPVVVAALSLGKWPGLLAGILALPVNLMLMGLFGHDGLEFIVNSPGGIIGSLSLVVIGVMVGAIRDLSVSFQNIAEERDEARKRVSALLEETQRANEELKRIDRTKDEFLSIVTHDLKTPLVSVLGYVGLLLDERGGKLSGKQRIYLQNIKRQSDKVQTMVDSILDYTRVELGKIKIAPEEFSINSQIFELLEDIMPQADQKKIAVEADLPPEQIMVNADKGMIGRVIANLLGNAIQYTPQGGKIEISLRREDDFVQLKVRDNGIGIPPEHIPRLFDKFFVVEQAKARERRSLGLGLHISKEFIQAHGGEIRVESPGKGKGSTFIFTLPAA
jgi:signal transduction histidine kinase